MSVQLHLGDCLSFMKTMPDGCVDAVITDPPYGIRLANHGAYRGDFGVMGDTDQALANSVIAWANKNDICIAAFCSPDAPYPGRWNSRLVWHKPGRGIGGDYEVCWLRDWEMILVHATSPIKNKASSVLRYPPADCNHHKCEKPIDLMAYLIDQLTNIGDTVFDPFMGSGTTGVAAVQLGRNFIGAEIDPGYFAIAQRRIADAEAQPPLFTIDAPKAKQLTLEEAE